MRELTQYISFYRHRPEIKASYNSELDDAIYLEKKKNVDGAYEKFKLSQKIPGVIEINISKILKYRRRRAKQAQRKVTKRIKSEDRNRAVCRACAVSGGDTNRCGIGMIKNHSIKNGCFYKGA